MSDGAADARSIEDLSDLGNNSEAVVRRWRTELALAKKGRYEKWVKQVKKTLKRYEDERPHDDDSVTKFNILWSNIETLGPAVYSKVPQVVVERRFLDRDPIGRLACRLLERTLTYQVEISDFHDAIKQARFDYLIAARGVSWIRYEATYSADDDQLTKTDAGQGEGSYREVIDEKTCVDYIHWQDYLSSPARTEKEVTWKAKRAFLTRDQLRKRFKKSLTPEEIRSIPLDHTPEGMSSDDAAKPENELLKKATVWEIWDKPSGKVIFIADQYGEKPLEVRKDPLGLHCFWPSPMPATGTRTNDTIIPIPDYHQYCDQARELDDLTTRISLLTDAIRAAGVYDSSTPILERLIEEGAENKLYPCDQWAAFSEKGGIQGAVSFLPIKEMAEVLIRLYEARQQVKQDLYEITGISDIIRGQSDGTARTATEQRIKGQFANLRLSDRQGEMARFAKDTLEIMGEMVAEHFDPSTIFMMSGFEQWGPEDHIALMGHNGGPPMEEAQPPMPQGQPMPPQGMAGPMAQPQQAMPNPMAQQAMPMPPGGQPIQAPPQSAMKMLPADATPEMRMQAMAMDHPQLMEDFGRAIALLRNDKLRGFRIDIETDSTIEPDQQMEKEARVEFLTASSQFLSQSLEVGMASPDMIPLLGKMLLFGVRGFKAGRELETAFEETLAKLEKQAAQPKPPQPSPEEIKAKAEADKMQMQMQMDQQRNQMEMQRQQQEDERQAQINAMEMQFKSQDHQMKMEEMTRKAQIDIMKYNLEMEKLQAGVAIDQQKMQIQAESMDRKAAYEAQTAERKFEFDSAAMDRQAEHEEASMDRQAKADERKAAIAEQAMKAKAKASANSGASK